MAIIQKRADQLKPGDVWVRKDVMPVPQRLVVLRGCGGVGGGSTWSIVPLDSAESPWTAMFNPNDVLDVESPDLTLAQQHAEELAGSLLVARDTLLNYPHLSASQFTSARNLAVENATALLDKIKPPEPPTLAETLEVVKMLLEGDDASVPVAERILDRARRAKLI